MWDIGYMYCKVVQRSKGGGNFKRASWRRDPDVHRDPCGRTWGHEDDLQWPAITSGYLCLSLAYGLDACIMFGYVDI